MARQPFLPYGRQVIEEDDIAAVVEVLRSDHLTTGPAVARFEAELATAVGAPLAVSVCTGTAALHAACFAAGVEAGDEVVVPALTFLATANCARYLGAEPIFADVDPDTGLVQIDDLERRLTEKTRVVIPVHLTGVPAEMEDIARVARGAGIRVIEDAAHALGARYRNDAVGSLRYSDMAIFSFHPVKHITTAEGGAVVVEDADLHERLMLFRNHGMTREPRLLRGPDPGPWYYEQLVLGHNLRLSDLHCALGISQLAKLGRFVARRRALARRYDALLGEIPVIQPVTRQSTGSGSAYHLYAVLIEFSELGLSRAKLMHRLGELGIGTQVHYIPVPAQPYYRDRGWEPEDFPGAQRYYERTLSLPLFPGMDDTDVDRVVESLHTVLSELGSR